MVVKVSDSEEDGAADVEAMIADCLEVFEYQQCYLPPRRQLEISSAASHMSEDGKQKAPEG